MSLQYVWCVGMVHSHPVPKTRYVLILFKTLEVCVEDKYSSNQMLKNYSLLMVAGTLFLPKAAILIFIYYTTTPLIA